MTNAPLALRAAEYVRMSTDLQCYSIANQQSLIREYATRHQLQIVRTYTDGGRSGLRLHRRVGLQRLLADVINGEAPFEVILVYDVSRWGRFQDADEAAHYEFLCRRAGKRIVYCAEQFDNDGSPMASIVKGLKRIMAGEYSRELSDKVFHGQARLAAMGFHVGARAPYGLRRMIIDPQGKPRGLMEFGQRKAMQNERVILVPGPADEVNIIRQVFRSFIDDGDNYQQIADRLNAQRIIPSSGLHFWTRHQVKGILSNEKYLGTMLYNRTSSKLSTPRIHNPSCAWVRMPEAFEPLISEADFEEARLRRAENPRKHRKRDLIAYLHRVKDEHGYLSGSLLRRLKSGPAPETYIKHFGSIDAALEAAGYERESDPRQSARRSAATRQQLNLWVPWLTLELMMIGYAVQRTSLKSMVINGQYRVSVVIPLTLDRSGILQIKLDKQADVVVVVGMPDPMSQGDWLVIDPADHPHRTLHWPIRSPFDRIDCWRCFQAEVANHVQKLFGQP